MPATHHATGHSARKGFTMNHDHTTTGLLPTGEVTTIGAIEQTSLTAYLIGGEWVPFERVHGRRPAVVPLVTF
jgi:hypothetical protein